MLFSMQTACNGLSRRLAMVRGLFTPTSLQSWQKSSYETQRTGRRSLLAAPQVLSRG
ncbi:MAG: hypothetical protein U0835_09395 [Isosphaeraceae bacterium]